MYLYNGILFTLNDVEKSALTLHDAHNILIRFKKLHGIKFDKK